MWKSNTCNTEGCDRKAMPGKYFCNKHIHGQRTKRPVSGQGSSYGTVKNKCTKSKEKKNEQ